MRLSRSRGFPLPLGEGEGEGGASLETNCKKVLEPNCKKRTALTPALSQRERERSHCARNSHQSGDRVAIVDLVRAAGAVFPGDRPRQAERFVDRGRHVLRRLRIGVGITAGLVR